MKVPHKNMGMAQGPQWPWLCFGVSLLLILLLVWETWTIVGPSTYTGADGKALQANILAMRHFGLPFEPFSLNPMQAFTGGIHDATNIWGNPVLWSFFSEDQIFASQISTLVAFSALASAIFALTRRLHLPLGASIMGSLSAIIVFPPFFYATGFLPLLAIAPNAAFSAALSIVAASLSYRVQDTGWGSVVTTGALVALILGYNVYVNVVWFVASIFMFIPLFAFCVLDAPSLRTIAGRVTVFVIAFVFLYTIGMVNYVKAAFDYSARVFFPTDWPIVRDQTPDFASWIFHSPLLKWTYAFFLIGWLTGLLSGGTSARKVGLLCIITFIVFVGTAALYLFAGLSSWTAPVPVYCEPLVAPIYALGAIAGYSSLLGRLGNSILRLARSKLSQLALRRAALVGALTAITLPALLGFVFNRNIVYGTRYTPGLVNILNEPWPANQELLQFLQAKIGVENNNRFRGLALVAPEPLDYPDNLTLVSLLREAIPTLSGYTTLESPLFYYFKYHAPGWGWFDRSASHIPADWQGIESDIASDALLQALGVRYSVRMVDSSDSSPPALPANNDLQLRLATSNVSVGAAVRRAYVYEYNDPNIGNYSPVHIRVADNALSAMRMFWDSSFDPRRSVILSREINLHLVSARESQMSFERGHIRVKAESSGRSMLVLPIHFSHCLSLDEEGTARLFPANLVQTGLLFENELDVRIRFQFRPFDATCREKDFADLRALGIVDDQKFQKPGSLRHPHAVSRLADLPAALLELGGSIK
jgi:hypothetical protein